MSQEDPFAPYMGDEDKTIIRPRPGGVARPSAEPSPAPVMATPAAPVNFGAPPQPAPIPAPRSGQVPLQVLANLPREAQSFQSNPLLAHAAALLSLAARLRNTPAHGDVAGLQQQLVNEIKQFENRCLQDGVTQEHLRMATYALCSLIDETILNTPWGAQSFWGHQSLLVLFHKEAWGGERFFQFVNQLVRQPAQNLHLLELAYLCLSLGFQGQYRIMHNGLNALEQLRAELYQLIQRVRGDFERELSIRWRGVLAGNTLARQIPAWVILATTAALLLLIYLGFALFINGIADPVHKQLYALGKEAIAWELPAAPLPKPEEPKRIAKYSALLAEEIGRNMVEVVDDHTLRIRNSFPSGSDQVKPEFLPMLNKIARALATESAPILVTGHTDDKPIFTARFPSNWHLSNARALHVADILLRNPDLGGKVRAEGRAEGEPLAPNDSAEHRARNRRVDILIR